MFETTYYEDYELNHERKTFGRTMTEGDIIVHAGQTGDFFPHHMDEEWCKTQDFKKRLVHGTLTFSVGVGLTASVINPVAMTYGYERLRFIKPVHIGDTLRTTVTITDKKDHKRPQFGIVTEHLEVTNQRGETVMVCDHLLLVEKKAGKASVETNGAAPG
ncbi:MaoC family dehydratase [Algisphaera agarilytica]|uniref:Acyl dehydratase n=1 Tax=Algisphaera agarilytica TaxID=1385975 RepID=A0A7X0H5I8_9BACT|nr:MaoC/PaaZ C-terminal domain-containing protein [Algisphaera agarilytica]MBB6429523.1 acyl dehydratase [Algisphaera agarilytica]